MVDFIFQHPIYQDCYSKLQQMEKERIFCRHDIGHFMDVARIAYIMNLEKQSGLRKVVIYGTALLHDIGRVYQYTADIPHEEASADIAGTILRDVPPEQLSIHEKEEIVAAIRHHRDESHHEMSLLEQIIAESDKKSRPCFLCEARERCKWPYEKRNKTLEN